MPRAIFNDRAQRCDGFPGTPVFFEIAELQNPPALPTLRLCISAGAPLPSAVGERISARWPEDFTFTAHRRWCTPDASEAAEYEDGFVGQPMQGVSIEK